jgi:predicted alpha/beta-fold hydrolase
VALIFIRDPLVFHDYDHETDPTIVKKRPELLEAVRDFYGHVYWPTPVGVPHIFRGNFMSLMTDIKNNVYSKLMRYPMIVYDKKETFKLSDGGQIYLCMMGSSFAKIDEDPKAEIKCRPLVFIIPGLTSSAYVPYMRSIVRECGLKDFEVCVINYRGIADIELTSPKLYHSMACDDVEEPLTYLY